MKEQQLLYWEMGLLGFLVMGWMWRLGPFPSVENLELEGLSWMVLADSKCHQGQEPMCIRGIQGVIHACRYVYMCAFGGGKKLVGLPSGREPGEVAVSPGASGKGP